MVYCSRCGTLNPDTATNCSNCGAPLFGTQTEGRPYTRHEHRHHHEDGYRRHGGGFGLVIVGLFIVIIGIAAIAGFSVFWQYFWPIVLVLIGVWILALGLRRNRRYRQAPTP